MKKVMFAFALLAVALCATASFAQSEGSPPPTVQEPEKQAPAAKEEPAAKPEEPAVKPKAEQEEKFSTAVALNEGEEPPSKKKLDWGLMVLLEYGTNINRDRPDYYGSVMLAPAFKFMYDHAFSVKFSAVYEFLDRIENYGWAMDDLILEYAYNKGVWDRKKPVDMSVNLGASFRYYVPISLNSRLADSGGQIRFIGRSAFQVWKFRFGLDFNGQKYFNKYLTWDTAETPGDPSWINEMGKDEYVENNTDFGLGEKLYVIASPIDGLDFTVSYAWLQSKRYDIIHTDDPEDVKYLNGGKVLPGRTTWSYSTQFIADVTYSFGEIPAIKKSKKLSVSPLGHLALSVGYSALVPELQNGGAKVSYNPFDPLWGYFYIDLAVVY
jgi:hypothetical protein